MVRNNESTHFTGVSWHNQKHKYYAYIKHENKRYSIGYYDDPLRALIARIHWMRKHGLNTMRNVIEFHKATGYTWIGANGNDPQNDDLLPPQS